MIGARDHTVLNKGVGLIVQNRTTELGKCITCKQLRRIKTTLATAQDKVHPSTSTGIKVSFFKFYGSAEL